MSATHCFEHFEKKLNRLGDSFGHRLAELKQPRYAESEPFNLTHDEIQLVERGQ